MKKVLICDPIHDTCITYLQSNNINVDYRPELTKQELISIISNYQGIIVRSNTTVDDELIAKADNLEIIGRAGTGTDNIDKDAATKRGIVVMNTPGGNTISAAEHTIAMLLALARNIPQADASMKSGLWERAKFAGTEIFEKTIGIIGLGQIGKEVAKRAQALGLNVIAYDPIITREVADDNGVTLVELEDLFISSDFITVHVPISDSTKNLISFENLKKCKDGVRIINTARGGIVNEKDILDSINSGKVEGAALDVFDSEPPQNRELVEHQKVITTPHLSASTEEALEKVASQIAEQFVDFFNGKDIRGAVNAFDIRFKNDDVLQPYIELAEKMGKILKQTSNETFESVHLDIYGEMLFAASSIITSAMLKGLLENYTDQPINLVNAKLVAKDLGLKVRKSKNVKHKYYSKLISIEAKSENTNRTISGTIFGKKDLWIVNFDNYENDFRPEGKLLIYDNTDVPGILANVTELLAKDGVNIADLSLGRLEQGKNVRTIIRIDQLIKEKLLKSLSKIRGVDEIYSIIC